MYAGGSQKCAQKKRNKGFFPDFLEKKHKNIEFLTKIIVLNYFLGIFATLANLSRIDITKNELFRSSNLVVPIFPKRL